MKRSTWISFFLLLSAGVGVWAGSAGNGFTYDDNIVILRNAHVQEPGHVGDIARGSYWGTAVDEKAIGSWGYRPLAILTYRLSWAAGGGDPFWFHFANIVLHAAAAVLFWLLLLRLGLGARPALVAAGLFAVHAVHAEAVAQVVGRAELLAALFLFGAAIVHVEAVRADARQGRRTGRGLLLTLAAALILFAGLLAKEDAAGLLPVALCADLFLVLRGMEKAPPAGGVPAKRAGGVTTPCGSSNTPRSRWGGRARLAAHFGWRYLVYLLPVAAFLVLRGALFGRPLPTFDVHFVDNPMALLPWWLRPLGAAAVFGKAMLLLVFPWRLSADYGFDQLPVRDFWAHAGFWAGIAVLAAGTLLAVRERRRSPALLFGWLFMLLAYLPVSNALFLVHTILGERLLYIPSAGFAVAVAALVERGLEARSPAARKATAAALAALLLFHAVRAPLRSADWKDDATLFESTARVATRSVRVLNNAGNVRYEKGDLEGAEERYRAALAIFPGYDDAAVNLAAILIRRGDGAGALALLAPVVARRPGHAAAERNHELAKKLAGKGK